MNIKGDILDFHVQMQAENCCANFGFLSNYVGTEITFKHASN